MTNLTCHSLPPLEYLQELFAVDETSPSGLRRIKTVSSRAKKGDVAGCPPGPNNCYWKVSITYGGKTITYGVHRIIYVMATGRNIDHLFIDHINGVDEGNVLSNLREATPAQNMYNRVKSAKPCTSKYKGVYWCKQNRSWAAEIRQGGRRRFLGRYHSEEAAARAYNDAALALHENFANLNCVPS
jgi:hypothetical protein